MLTAPEADRILREGVAAMQRGDAKAARHAFAQVAAAGNGVPPPWLLIAQACRLDRDDGGELAALDRLGNANSGAVDGEAGGIEPDPACRLHLRWH